MKVAIVGAGAWGTALAQHVARRHSVLLWMRDATQCKALEVSRRNERYLPTVALEPRIEVGCEIPALQAWLTDAQDTLLVIATPVAGLEPALAAIAPGLPASCRGVLWLCKGIEPGARRLPHVIAERWLAGRPGGTLSGPSFAEEVAAGLPVALTVAGTDARIEALTMAACHHGAARIYTSTDLLGVELGGALKNVMAIAAGISDGLGLGANARAALITRALVEMSRLGAALGAQPETFVGLTGLGDLVLTCTGGLSRNRRVGMALAAGQSLDEILSGLGHVAEGVLTAPVARSLAHEAGVEMPLTEAVCAVLDGRQSAPEALRELLAREPRAELERR